MSEVKVVEGSVEYLYADIRADHSIGTQAVAMSVSATTTPNTFTDAEWVGDPGKYAAARLLLDGSLAAGLYHVFVKITDSPEIPIIYAGRLRVT